MRCIACMLSRVWLFATPWTVTHQAPLSSGFYRQEHWSELPFPSPVMRWMSDKTRLTFQFSSVQSLSRVWLFATPWTAAHQASLSISNSQGLLRLITHFYSLCLSKIHLFLVYFYCIFLEIWDHSVNFFSINPVREFDTLVFSPLQCNFQTHKQVETLHSESPMFPSPALTVAIFKQGFMVTVRTWIMRICVFVICTIFRERRPWWLRW